MEQEIYVRKEDEAQPNSNLNPIGKGLESDASVQVHNQPWNYVGSPQRNFGIDRKLVDFENLVRLQFGDSLTCMPVITSKGSKFVSVWNEIPECSTEERFTLKYLPLFYIIVAPDEKSNFELKLVTFHGKVIEELKDSSEMPLTDGCKIEFIEKLKHLKLCQGVKFPNSELKCDLRTLSKFYLIEQFGPNVIIRSRNCNFAIYEDSGSTACSTCLALNGKEHSKRKKYNKPNNITDSLTIFGEGSSSTTIFPSPFSGDLSEDNKALIKLEASDEFQGGEEMPEELSTHDHYSVVNDATVTDLEHNDCDFQLNIRSTNFPQIQDSDLIDQKFNLPSTVSIYPEDPSVLPPPPMKKKSTSSFRCKHCDYMTSEKPHMIKHISVMHKKLKAKAHKCKYCNYRTDEKPDLLEHVKENHSELKPYSCETCPFKAKDKRALDHHVISNHDQSKAYLCEHCSYSTPSKGRLTCHIKAVHDKVFL